MEKKISLSDIAKMFNVSSATISYIINGKAKEKRISKELAERVLEKVEKIGYKPNQLAKSLRTGTSKIIGLMVDDISNPFFADVAKMIDDLAYTNGYRIIFCSTDNETKKAKEIITMFRDRNVDGYIIVPPEGIEKEIETLLKDNIPVVLFDRFLTKITTSYVVTDNCNSTYQAIIHFISQGLKHPALILSDSMQPQMQQRECGYLKAVKEFSLDPIVEKVHVTGNREDIVAKTTALLKENTKIDAILFSSNYLTICGLEVFEKLKIAIPDDVAIIAFDDHELFNFYSPSITAIVQPLKKFSEEILHLLFKQIKGNGQVSQIVIPSSLIQRASSIKMK
ncbi:MAG: LacI family DNA-binding transcriptional regulator [Janthinobacterium lividum]